MRPLRATTRAAHPASPRRDRSPPNRVASTPPVGSKPLGRTLPAPRSRRRSGRHATIPKPHRVVCSWSSMFFYINDLRDEMSKCRVFAATGPVAAEPRRIYAAQSSRHRSAAWRRRRAPAAGPRDHAATRNPDCAVDIRTSLPCSIRDSRGEVSKSGIEGCSARGLGARPAAGRGRQGPRPGHRQVVFLAARRRPQRRADVPNRSTPPGNTAPSADPAFPRVVFPRISLLLQSTTYGAEPSKSGRKSGSDGGRTRRTPAPTEKSR